MDAADRARQRTALAIAVASLDADGEAIYELMAPLPVAEVGLVLCAMASLLTGILAEEFGAGAVRQAFVRRLLDLADAAT